MSHFFTTESGGLPEITGGFTMLTVKSPSLGHRADITLFDAAAHLGIRTQNIPVVILLHGVYGSHWAWASAGKAHQVLLRMIEQGRTGPMVLVMPSDGLYGDGSGYLPHHDSNYEKWIVQDVVAAVREQIKNVGSDSPFFITGLSMGGYGALRLGARYADVFAGFSGMSSITGFDQMKLFVQDFDRLCGHVVVQENVLDVMLKHKGELRPFRFDCGSEDLLIEHNRGLHTRLIEAGIPHEYAEHPGDHRWIYWEEHLADQLEFFAGIARDTSR